MDLDPTTITAIASGLAVVLKAVAVVVKAARERRESRRCEHELAA